MKELLIVGAIVTAASLSAMRIFGSSGFCGTPNMPYAFGALIGLSLIALGMIVGAVQWAWRRTRARD
jgi:hypothetical protein